MKSQNRPDFFTAKLPYWAKEDGRIYQTRFGPIALPSELQIHGVISGLLAMGQAFNVRAEETIENELCLFGPLVGKRKLQGGPKKVVRFSYPLIPSAMP